MNKNLYIDLTYIDFPAMMISLPFLLAIFLKNSIFPEPNVHSKNLMCYVACLTVYYISLSVAISQDLAYGTFCSTVGYIIYYFGLATFFWLNVMCIDIYLSLNSFKMPQQFKLNSYMKWLYYGFGTPLIITFGIYLLDHTTIGLIMEEKYHPKIGMEQHNGLYTCFIQSNSILKNYLESNLEIYIFNFLFYCRSLLFKNQILLLNSYGDFDSRFSIVLYISENSCYYKKCCQMSIRKQVNK